MRGHFPLIHPARWVRLVRLLFSPVVMPGSYPVAYCGRACRRVFSFLVHEYRRVHHAEIQYGRPLSYKTMRVSRVRSVHLSPWRLYFPPQRAQMSILPLEEDSESRTLDRLEALRQNLLDQAAVHAPPSPDILAPPP